MGVEVGLDGRDRAAELLVGGDQQVAGSRVGRSFCGRRGGCRPGVASRLAGTGGGACRQVSAADENLFAGTAANLHHWGLVAL